MSHYGYWSTVFCGWDISLFCWLLCGGLQLQKLVSTTCRCSDYYESFLWHVSCMTQPKERAMNPFILKSFFIKEIWIVVPTILEKFWLEDIFLFDIFSSGWQKQSNSKHISFGHKKLFLKIYVAIELVFIEWDIHQYK